MRPLKDNVLRSCQDVQEAVRDLVAPLEQYSNPGNIRVKPGVESAHFPNEAAEIEGSARPLWGIFPLVAGGGALDNLERYREGLRNGTDPDHPEYWGAVTDRSQKAVEMAPIGVALGTRDTETTAIARESAGAPSRAASRRADLELDISLVGSDYECDAGSRIAERDDGTTLVRVETGRLLEGACGRVIASA